MTYLLLTAIWNNPQSSAKTLACENMFSNSILFYFKQKCIVIKGTY
jgi:hypothetical protein